MYERRWLQHATSVQSVEACKACLLVCMAEPKMTAQRSQMFASTDFMAKSAVTQLKDQLAAAASEEVVNAI